MIFFYFGTEFAFGKDRGFERKISMKKNILDILYNPSSLSSVSSNVGSSCQDQGSANDYHVLEALENLHLAKSESGILKYLECLKQALSWELSRGVCSILLKQFHLFLCRVTREHVNSVELFQKSCVLIEGIKQILGDEECLIHESLWVELEKSVYVLSLWQRCGLNQDSSRFH